jgi:hypothetical protein
VVFPGIQTFDMTTRTTTPNVPAHEVVRHTVLHVRMKNTCPAVTEEAAVGMIALLMPRLHEAKVMKNVQIMAPEEDGRMPQGVLTVVFKMLKPKRTLRNKRIAAILQVHSKAVMDILKGVISANDI